jgi:hypothetical protein
MALAYVSQKAAQLTYYLYDRKLAPEVFSIFRSRRIEREKFTADMWIIGMSHVLRIEGEGRAFTEVVAAAHNGLPTEGLVESTELWARDLQYTKNDTRLRYQVSSRKLVIDDDADYEEKHLEIAELETDRLFFSFPARPDARLAPFTAVTPGPSEKLFEVETVHAYPEERTLIYTQTKVDPGHGNS